jgi:hypothetical protein
MKVLEASCGCDGTVRVAHRGGVGVEAEAALQGVSSVAAPPALLPLVPFFALSADPSSPPPSVGIRLWL